MHLLEQCRCARVEEEGDVGRKPEGRLHEQVVNQAQRYSLGGASWRESVLRKRPLTAP